MITITEKAGNHLQGVSKGKDKVLFSVEGGGCSGCLLYTSDAADE